MLPSVPAIRAASSTTRSNSSCFTTLDRSTRIGGRTSISAVGTTAAAIRRRRIGTAATSPCPSTMATILAIVSWQDVEQVKLFRPQLEDARIRTQLIHSEELAGSVKMIPERRTSYFIQRTYAALAMLRHYRDDGIVQYLLVVQQIGTMTRHEYLGPVGRVPETIDEHPRRRRVQRDLGLLDTDASPNRFRTIESLKQRDEYAERAQGSIRHVAREELPRVAGSANLLPELDGLLGTDRPCVDARDSGNHLAEVLLDSLLDLRRAAGSDWQARWRCCCRPVSGDRLERVTEAPGSLRDSGCRTPCLRARRIPVGKPPSRTYSRDIADRRRQRESGPVCSG